MQSEETTTPVAIEDLPLLLDRVYEQAFYEVAKYVSRRGGSLQDAKDIAHDAIIALHDQLHRGRNVDNEVAYIVATARNMWYQRSKMLSASQSLSDLEELTQNEVATINEKKLLHLLEVSGQKCLELLTACYFTLRDIKVVANKFGFSSEHSASVQKYKCIEKLRNKVKQNALAYEDFFE